jgi:hypothetical protein
MRRLISPQASRCVTSALFEYLMIVLPVGIYVVMEAFHHDHWELVIESPEWAIATIFLSFHGAVLYVQSLKKSGRKLSEGVLLLAAMAVLVVIIAAIVNAYDDLDSVTRRSVLFRTVLFAIASVAFLAMVSGAKFVAIHSQGLANDSE